MARCSHKGCDNSYKSHRWGKVKAHGLGWFFQRDGKVFCPEHLPDWVKAWRIKASARQIPSSATYSSHQKVIKKHNAKKERS